MADHTREWHRKQDWKHAIRKKKIDKFTSVCDVPLYDNLHQYSKNAIHCSCPLCAFNSVTMSDKRKNIDDNQKLKDFKEGDGII